MPFVDVDGELMPLRDGEVLRIPADCMRLTIHAYAFTYSLQNPRLNYYLEGFDKEPASVSRQELQPVSYTNLGGGKYIFHFRYRHHDGQRGEYHFCDAYQRKADL